MKLQDLEIKEFLAKTYGKDPVPGGGSISALCGALASSLAEMVTALTIGRKKYVEVEDEMKTLAEGMSEVRKQFLEYIDKDADAYEVVFNAFKLPKETEEEKKVRAEAIEAATIHAAEIPMQVATMAMTIMADIRRIAVVGNKNAVTDACVAMMCARTAALGAILNVRINLGGISDEVLVDKLRQNCDYIEKEVRQIENELLTNVKL